MKTKKIKKEQRDLEQERQDLLRLMKRHISPELRKEINKAVSIVTKAENIPIKMSNRGACDASQK